jgi:hypothetical protein
VNQRTASHRVNYLSFVRFLSHPRSGVWRNIFLKLNCGEFYY